MSKPEKLETAFTKLGWLYRRFNSGWALLTPTTPANDWEKSHLICASGDIYKVANSNFTPVAGPFNSVEAAMVSWRVLSSINQSKG